MFNEPWWTKDGDLTDLNHCSRPTLSFKLRRARLQTLPIILKTVHNRWSMKWVWTGSSPLPREYSLPKGLNCCLHGTNARTQTRIIGRQRDRACPISYQIPCISLTGAIHTLLKTKTDHTCGGDETNETICTNCQHQITTNKLAL